MTEPRYSHLAGHYEELRENTSSDEVYQDDVYGTLFDDSAVGGLGEEVELETISDVFPHSQYGKGTYMHTDKVEAFLNEHRDRVVDCYESMTGDTRKTALRTTFVLLKEE